MNHFPRARRVRWLLVLLSVLALLVVVRDVRRRLPRDPRLYLMNESFGTFDGLVIQSDCGDVAVPPLEEDQEIQVKLILRPGCRYRMNKLLDEDELLRFIEFARAQRADVEITIGIDFVDADLTTRHQWW